ncbi:MAG: helix-turn-helix domain-containing protein [Huintestinicola sp.]
MSKYDRIRDLREDADLTQKNVADSLFMHLTQYRRYETGEREIPLSVAIMLAEKYNVSLDYISGISSIKEPNSFKLNTEEHYLIENFRSLNDVQKGRLLERLDVLHSSQNKHKKK